MASQNTVKTLGPTPILYTSSFDKKCKFVLVSTRGAGPSLARGPIRRNRSYRLKTGPVHNYLFATSKKQASGKLGSAVNHPSQSHTML